MDTTTATAPKGTLARSALYDTLAAAFTPPNGTRFRALRSDETDAAVREAIRTFPDREASEDLLSAWEAIYSVLGDYEAIDYEAEFLRLFEVGIPRAPCPLYESAYDKQDRRREVMGELVRFYRHFRLTLGERAREMPDHLRVELEFMHFLTYSEARAAEAGEPTEGLRRAQRDLLERHLTRWTPRLWERVQEEDSPAFSVWSRLARRFLEAERAHVLAAPPTDRGQGQT